MKNIEREIRYSINDKILKEIIRITDLKEEKEHILDITYGKKGFSSLSKYGYICRIRQKDKKIWMEVKQRQLDGSFIESKVNINKVKDGMDFFSLLYMKPYLYIDRKREIRAFKGLKIFIDEVEMLGKFVEIEYQEVDNENSLVEEFKEKVGIKSDPQPLYGDIFKNRIENDESFKKKFVQKLNDILK